MRPYLRRPRNLDTRQIQIAILRGLGGIDHRNLQFLMVGTDGRKDVKRVRGASRWTRTLVDSDGALDVVLWGVTTDLNRQRSGKVIVKYLHNQPIRSKADRIAIGIHRHHPHAAGSHRQTYLVRMAEILVVDQSLSQRVEHGIVGSSGGAARRNLPATRRPFVKSELDVLIL